MRQYLGQHYLYLTTHNFEAWLACLEDSWDHTLAEQLDHDFQKAPAHSVAKCKQKPNVAYVEKLATTHKEKCLIPPYYTWSVLRLYGHALAHALIGN